jgi:hypothetical protein
VHELIAAPFLGEHFVLRPGAGSGVRLPRAAYDELAAAPADAVCPPWLADAADWAFGLDLAGRLLADAVLVRYPSPLGYSRASYEVNLGVTGTFSGLTTASAGPFGTARIAAVHIHP